MVSTKGKTPDEIYAALSAQFETHFKDERGYTYVNGKQVIDRLTNVLGINGWKFDVHEQDVNYDTNQVWVRGTLQIKVEDEWLSRSQFGSSTLKRRRSDNVVLDIGFDLKGAATDCVKKCATLFGIGLYLYDKETPFDGPVIGGNGQQQRPSQSQGQQQQSTAQNQGNASVPASGDTEALYCEECSEMLTETRFKDQTVWSPTQLAVYGRRKHGKILDMKCYREANNVKRSAEEALQSVAF